MTGPDNGLSHIHDTPLRTATVECRDQLCDSESCWNGYHDLQNPVR